MVVAPVQSAADQEHQRDDGKFCTTDFLFAAVAVVPREHQHDRQPERRGHRPDLQHATRPLKSIHQELQPLQQAPRSRDVSDAPLHHLAATQRVPQSAR